MGIRFIEAAGESANIDAKGPIAWDNGESAACLTKDILALANRRDGGVIVIGKQESQPGKFMLTGLTDEQASSFETTKVATWVNNHCSPPITLVCYRQEFQGQQFIVIAVSEFHDVPVVCTKQYELSAGGKSQKVLLRKGAVYVRTANVESAPLSSVEEMRELIGLATTKRADQMLSMFQAMLKGKPLLAEKPHEELFQAERQEVRAALDSELNGQLEQGAWTFLCYPVQHKSNRWEETDTLKKVVERCTVRIRREFPPMTYDTHIREWGICNRHYEDAFGLTRSGLFLAARLFRENSVTFKNPWQPNPDIGAGHWLDFKLNLSLVIEFFMFVSRFAENFEIGEELVYAAEAGPLAGRLQEHPNRDAWIEAKALAQAEQEFAEHEINVLRDNAMLEKLLALWEQNGIAKAAVLNAGTSHQYRIARRLHHDARFIHDVSYVSIEQP